MCDFRGLFSEDEIVFLKFEKTVDLISVLDSVGDVVLLIPKGGRSDRDWIDLAESIVYSAITRFYEVAEKDNVFGRVLNIEGIFEELNRSVS